MNELESLGVPKIETDEVRVGGLLKQGAFGRIYDAKVNGDQRVVKIFNIRSGHTSLMQSFIREAKILHLARDYELIVKIHGWFVGSCGIDVGLILEKAQQDFDEYLHSQYSLMSELHRLDYIIALLFDLVEAMIYLHEQNIVHRDLKPSNCLLFSDEDMNVNLKLADFGSTRFLSSDPGQMTVQVGTVLWQAPEVNEREGYDERVDIYSFGVIVWECLTRKYPFTGNSKSKREMKECNKDDWQIMFQKRSECHPGPIPKLCNDDITRRLRNLIEICCSMDPDRRPDADSIFDVLLSLWNEYRDNVLTIQYNINEYPTDDSREDLLSHAPFEPLTDLSSTINYVHSNSVLDTIDSTAEEESSSQLSFSGLSLTNEFTGTDNFEAQVIPESELPQSNFDNSVQQFHEP